ncbi:DUF659 family protein [Rhizoctonia solani 123E]|uniref:DUF659 family protein n=1 Tax=Rhizoctonia solani 123E TaxID=1423351 RepID=A0A074RNJ5_9AGAM|nr:DUF659 family protein [Rhizoctonia solani 123E]
MSALTSFTSSQNTSGSITLDSRLLKLYSSLRNLPESLSEHPDVYPSAEKFVLDEHDIEFYGSRQGALNHRLELIFGSRSTGSVIRFKGRGRALEAIVYTLKKYIDGDDGDNVLLWKWVEDLTHAATQMSATQTKTSHLQSPVVEAAAKPSSSRRSGAKRRVTTRAPRKRRSEAVINAAKAVSSIRWPHNPADLEDYTPTQEVSGRERDEFLDVLTIPSRIFKHAQRCNGLGIEVREEIQRRSASLSLASKVQQQGAGDTTSVSLLTTEEIRQKEERVNHALLKWLCDRLIPPSAVDCLRWREFVAALDDNVSTASGSTISDNFITTEAAYIRKESVGLLSKSNNLTLSYDGGTTRGHESVYTVHATVPSTRYAYLLDGSEASGVSHTAEHLCRVLNKHLQEIGPERFSCIVSDNAGNTRAARALIEKEYPWIIPLQDACHHQSNTAKDIGQLPHFQSCTSKMRSIATHFHTSTFAARHLSALCLIHGVSESIVAVGNTRFVSYYYAARSVLNCLPLILQLISSGVLDLNSVFDHFVEELRQLCTILEPFARSIKCLESSHSTPADVYIFWLAIIARLHELFKHNLTINGAGIPKGVMEEITSIVNSRHQEMFQNPVYLAGFFLDIRFRNSDVFLGYAANMVHIQTTSADLASDRDLRRSLPAYTLAGTYLVKLLGQLYNKDPNSAPFSHYSSWQDIQVAFRRQLLTFTRGLSPFEKRHVNTQTSHEYWETLLSVPSADLLAMVGCLLASIVPNSMAEERTMSTITKLNSPDRSSQKVSTLIDMATIRQHYKREEACTILPSRSLRPSVCFADLTPAAQILTPDCSSIESEDPAESAYNESQDDIHGRTAMGSRHYFEVEHEDGVFLASKMLSKALSDRTNVSQKLVRPLESPLHPEPTHKRQRVDIDSIIF